ncbi:MAG TPA: hypothetical protein VH120_21285 [Gemmataceae bacterium]|nr:hypothetical protein [Gemmataceae bacterium]
MLETVEYRVPVDRGIIDGAAVERFPPARLRDGAIHGDLLWFLFESSQRGMTGGH